MKIYEIVKGMMEGEYVRGDKFVNSDMGEIFICGDELLWWSNFTSYTIMLGDDSEWEKV